MSNVLETLRTMLDELSQASYRIGVLAGRGVGVNTSSVTRGRDEAREGLIGYVSEIVKELLAVRRKLTETTVEVERLRAEVDRLRGMHCSGCDESTCQDAPGCKCT